MLSRLRSIARVQSRAFAAPANAVLLDRAEVQSRVLNVLQSHAFVPAAKLSPTASFVHDLGLDELHAAQLATSFQREFCVEVPATAAVTSVDSAVAFLSAHPLAK